MSDSSKRHTRQLTLMLSYYA
uniref:Uncharacterized protein n=1 Tax=Anguilla anguilla TaxID=7936 RepID=A0A0E9UDM7_ANGAN